MAKTKPTQMGMHSTRRGVYISITCCENALKTLSYEIQVREDTGIHL